MVFVSLESSQRLDSPGKQKWTVVVDYRKLSECTIDDKYSLPNISDLLNKYFTTLDLSFGFHQIDINPEDIPKAAVSVENGNYEFIRMPFGMNNARPDFNDL